MAPDKLGLDSVQWDILKAAPLHVFSLVAGADSLADGREWNGFCAAVRASTDHPAVLVREVMIDVASGLDENTAHVEDASRALEGLRAARSIVDDLAGGAANFREALLALGFAVAEASGAQPARAFTPGVGLTWVLASGTSAMEHEALARAAEALGIQPTDRPGVEGAQDRS